MNRKVTLKFIGLVFVIGHILTLPNLLLAQTCSIVAPINTTADTVYYSGGGLGCGIFSPTEIIVTLYENDVFIMDPPVGDSVAIAGNLTVNFNNGGKVVIQSGDGISVGGDLVIPSGPGIFEINGILDINDDILGSSANNIRVEVYSTGVLEADSVRLGNVGILNVSGNASFTSGIELKNNGRINVLSGATLSANGISALDNLSIDVNGDLILQEDIEANNDLDIDVFTGGNLEANDIKGNDDFALTVDGGGLVNLSGDIDMSGDASDLTVSGNVFAENILLNDFADINVNGTIVVSDTFEVGNNAQFRSISGTGGILGDTLKGGTGAYCPGGLCPLYGFASCSPTSFCAQINFVANNSLPVEWLSFESTLRESGVLLQWSTASELNNSHFEIERRVVGLEQNFRTIGQVQGAGNSETIQYYQFTDDKLPLGKVLYRIRQVDFDGAYDYSKTIEVNLDINSINQSIKTYPNPAREVMYTYLPATDSEIDFDIEVRNLQGQRMMQRNVPSSEYPQTISWDLSSLPNGVYIIQIKSEKNLHRDKIIKR